MRNNQLKGGALLSYASMGLGYIVSILYTPVMIRILGQSEYGLYNLVGSVVAYLGILNFGFGSAYLRYYSRFKVNDKDEDIAKLNGIFFVIFIIIGLGSLLVGMLLIFNSDWLLGSNLTLKELKTAKYLMLIMVINISLSFPGIVFNSYIVSNEKFIFQKIIQLIRIVVNPFLILPILFLGYGSIGLAIITSFINLIIIGLNITFCLKKMNMQFEYKKLDTPMMKEIVMFSSYIFINLIVNEINWNVDKLILGRIKGTSSVAIYGLASQLFIYYMTLSVTISSVFTPRINNMVAEKQTNQELTNLLIKVGRIQFIILGMFFTGFIFFGRQFIMFWVGDDYKDSYFIFIILSFSSTIPLFQNLGIDIQLAKNKHHFRAWLYLIIAIGNIIITIPLTKLYGGIGAALGTAVGQVIGNTILMNLYYHIKIGLDMKLFWKEILKLMPSIAISLVLGILMGKVLDISNARNFIFSGIGYTLIYIYSMWLFGMNKFEKKLIQNSLDFFLVKRGLK